MAGDMASTTVTIVNFEKYKGRKDIINNSWFRLSNRFLEDSDFFDFTFEEKFVWIYLLSLASQKNHAHIHVSYQHAHHVCNLTKNTVTSAIEKLCKIGCLKMCRTRTLRGRYVDVTHPCATLQNKTEQDTTLHNKQTNAHAEAFADFYKSYPRKIGKTRAEKKFLSLLKSGKDPNEIKRASGVYRMHCETNGVEVAFVKHPVTFLGEWTDWLDPEVGSSDLKRPSDMPDLSNVKWDDE